MIEHQQDIASPQWNPYEVQERDERWGDEVKRKKKDVPSALMQRLQHGSCSSQKEERDRANKH